MFPNNSLFFCLGYILEDLRGFRESGPRQSGSVCLSVIRINCEEACTHDRS